VTSVNADITVTDATASITVHEAAASAFVLPGARISSNMVPQQIVNVYSDAQLLTMVPTSWKAAYPLLANDTATSYLSRYLLTQANQDQARAQLSTQLAAAGTQTDYQIATTTYANKLIADANAATGGGTVGLVAPIQGERAALSGLRPIRMRLWQSLGLPLRHPPQA
jgi:hypothetical protein